MTGGGIPVTHFPRVARCLGPQLRNKKSFDGAQPTELRQRFEPREAVQNGVGLRLGLYSVHPLRPSALLAFA
jgi:hypothetical protein